MAMSREVRLASALLLWWGLGAVMAEQPTTRSATRPTTTLSAKRTAELVERLGHPQWRVRERASAVLKGGDRDVLEALAVSYKTRKAPEIRLRIKEVVEHLVMMTELGRTGGFLGVAPQLITRTENRRIPQGQAGVMVVEVLPDTAAAASGLAPGDIILTVAGQPLKTGVNEIDFRTRITRLGAGAKVGLTVLRGDEVLELQATLGARPLAHADRRSDAYKRGQKRFAEVWHASFDPNDLNVGLPKTNRDRRVWERQQLLEIEPPMQLGGRE